ncbi:glycosyltransferase family A protein [Pedobacter sp. L105]|uniref:glycosyltransferase family 2 protein n=1 Tax=Pedobacter sp. L105 TaxID=1641871 RepID=UPI00131E2039|nr:glycosyltransferase family A protein [Pedobacter sp. L105]
MSENYPLISCICISNGNHALLNRAIACFQSQNYPNKELVISYDQNKQQIKAVIENLSDDRDLQLSTIEQTDRFGDALNNSVNVATGDYICLWNDDDWYHPSRLWFQYNCIQGTRYDASVLNRIILYDAISFKAYVSSSYLLSSSLLCKKMLIQSHPFNGLSSGENLPVIDFLVKEKSLFYMDDCPFLYAFIYYGRNNIDYWIYKHIFNKSELLNKELTNTIYDLLEIPD